MNKVITVGNEGLWLRNSLRTDDGTVPVVHRFRMTNAQFLVDLAWVARTRLATREFAMILCVGDTAQELALLEPSEYPSIEDDRIIFSTVSSVGQATFTFQGVWLIDTNVVADDYSLIVYPLRKRNVKVDYAIKFSGAG